MGALRGVLRAFDRLVDAAAVALLALVLALGCYALWDSGAVRSAADPERWEAYRPTVPIEKFDELVAINPDVIGWVSVYGTKIDYPVCQADDARTYLTTDATGEHSMSGAPFIEPESDPAFGDFATFVYAHHMADGMMFGQISDFASRSFFSEHRYGDLYAGGRHWGLEFVCYLPADAYDASVYRASPDVGEEGQGYLRHLLDMATWRRETATPERIVCLSTCSTASTNGRSVLVARVCEETFDDPFAEPTRSGTGVDPLSQLPLAAVVAMGAGGLVAAWRAGRRARGARIAEGGRP